MIPWISIRVFRLFISVSLFQAASIDALSDSSGASDHGMLTNDAVVVNNPQNPYLKEIVLGRCYENPPTIVKQGASTLCPFLVDSFWSVLEGRLEEDIVTRDFYMYWSTADFDTPKDTALLVWPPPSSSVSVSASASSKSDNLVVLPETTPGGALLQGLVFCGSDKRLDCPVEYWKQRSSRAGALSAFWGGAYFEFARQVHGRMRMLVLDDNFSNIPSLWEANVLPFLNASKVTAVDMIAVDCDSRGVSELVASLQRKSKIPASCNAISNINNNSSIPSAEACSLEELLLGHKPTLTTTLVSNHNNAATKIKDTHSSNTGLGDSSSIECRCPTTYNSSSQVYYEYLFWALMLLISACAYSYWSVRHYLPDYHRIPDVSPEHGLLLAATNGSNGQQLPKQ